MATTPAQGSATREDRIADLYTKLRQPLPLGATSFEDYQFVCTEYMMMKTYAAKLENLMNEVVGVIEEFVPEDRRPKGLEDLVNSPNGQEHEHKEPADAGHKNSHH